MYLVYRILVIILIISFVTGIIDIIYEHKHHLKKESISAESDINISLDKDSMNEVVVDDEEII